MIAACLNFNHPNLAEAMNRQIPGILVIDNGSERWPRGQVLRIDHNRYFSGGWNWAMQRLETDYVWMMNDDVEGVSWDMFERIVRFMRNDAHTAIVTPAFNSPHGLFRRRETGGFREVTWVDWCCPVVDRAAFAQVGMFDEAFASYGADLDICHRLRQAGYRFYVCDDFEINHLGSVTILDEGLTDICNNVGHMDALMFGKWGKHWWEMAGG